MPTTTARTATLTAEVLATVTCLGSATTREVFDALPARPGLTIAGVSNALRRLQLTGYLWRESASHPQTGAYRYHLSPDWMPPCVGERLRDSIDPYLRAVE